MRKNNILIVSLFIAVISLTAVLGATTFAFWTKSISNNGNTISTAHIAITVNGADNEGDTGAQLSIENLYPSNIHYVEKQIIVSNDGSIDVQYELTFTNEDSEDNLVYANILVSFDLGTTWENINEASFIQNSLLVEGSETLTVFFRLDPTLEDLDTMNQQVEFKINVKAIQLEDTFR